MDSSLLGQRVYPFTKPQTPQNPSRFSDGVMRWDSRPCGYHQHNIFLTSVITTKHWPYIITWTGISNLLTLSSNFIKPKNCHPVPKPMNTFPQLSWLTRILVHLLIFPTKAENNTVPAPLSPRICAKMATTVSGSVPRVTHVFCLSLRWNPARDLMEVVKQRSATTTH